MIGFSPGLEVYIQHYILFCLNQSESVALIPIILWFSRTSFWVSDFNVSSYLGPLNLPIGFISIITIMGACRYVVIAIIVMGKRWVRPNGELDTELSTGHRTIFRERNK